MTQPALDVFEPLLEIICCPYTRLPLALMTLPELYRSVAATGSSRIPDGTIGALVSTASSHAYPIIGQVISFLEQDILRLSANVDSLPISESSSVTLLKLEVKKWYDEFGWKQIETGQYGDTSLFSQVGHSAHGFYEMISHLSLLDRFVGGEFFLDAASGAIPHPEYLAYTWFYKYRVCVDISLTALQEAASKLGSKGFYCMADICRMPFRDNVFDGIVSGYTIQHVPESDQRQAVTELHRVLAPKKSCCIMTDLGLSRNFTWPMLWKVLRLIGRVIKTPDRELQASTKSALPPPPAILYCHTRDVAWWRKTLSEMDCEFSLQALRLLAKDEFEGCFDNSLAMAKFLRMLETSMPKLLTRYCRYGLVEFSKTQSDSGTHSTTGRNKK
jgi:uncharacterized protein YbaR (Trm112 family)